MSFRRRRVESEDAFGRVGRYLIFETSQQFVFEAGTGRCIGFLRTTGSGRRWIAATFDSAGAMFDAGNYRTRGEAIRELTKQLDEQGDNDGIRE